MKGSGFNDILQNISVLFFHGLLYKSERMKDMGKSLKGKELGTGIRQRNDGLYQARFTNRFGKRQVIYDKHIMVSKRK